MIKEIFNKQTFTPKFSIIFALMVLVLLCTVVLSARVMGITFQKVQTPQSLSPTPTVSSTVETPVQPTPSQTPATLSKPLTLKSPTPKPTNTPSVIVIATPSPTPSATPNTQSSSNDPHIESITPSEGSWQEVITIKGKNFGTSQGSVSWYNQNNQVSAGSPIESWSDTEIKAKIAGAASNYEFQLTISKSDGKQSNRLSFKVVQGQPFIETISPQSAKPGDTVTITGGRFGTGKGKVEFYAQYPTIAGTADVISWSETSIQIKIPNTLEQNKEYAIAVIAQTANASSSVKFYTTGN